MRFHLKGHFSEKLFYAPKKIRILTLLIAVYYLGWAIVEPFFPIYLNEIFGDYSHVGMVISSVYLFTIITALFFGQFINRVSKNFMISLSLFFYIPASFLFLSITSLSGFVLFQVYHSIVRAPLWISSEAYIRKNVIRKKVSEALGTFYSGYGLALVFGPLIGAFLIYRIGFSIFYSISIFAALAFIVSLFIKRSNKEAILTGLQDTIFKDGFIIKEFKDFIKNKPLIYFAIFIFFYYFSTYHLFMVVPLFFRELNFSYMAIGLIYALFFIPLVFESIFSKIKHKKMAVIISLLINAIILFLVGFIDSIIIIFISVFIMGILFAIINPLLKGRITYFMPKRNLGELGGIEYAIINFAAFLSFLTAGFISELYGLNSMFFISSFLLFGLSLYGFKKKLLSV